MQAFNKQQLITKGMMDLNFQGKLNKQIVDTIAVRQKEAIRLFEDGKYQESCDVTESVLDDYGMDKSFGQAPAPKQNDSAESSSSSSSDASAESSSEATPMSGSSEPSNE